ncbi:DNA polymerase [Bacillus inaquosorum]|uniref:DNA polymerase n=1 Tax=Bacillus inaquosorum TaxID=483913 RepID=UPI00227DADA8|nr:DNA polymerase [Bacillus inaquosorum]
MEGLRLNLNALKPAAPKTDAVQATAKRKAEAKKTETLDEAFVRLSESKFTDKERRQFDAAYQAFRDGNFVRTGTGKLTKKEVCEIGRTHLAETEAAIRRQRIEETLANKPDNYYILTDDSELPGFVERIREEVRRQRTEWPGRFEKIGVDSLVACDFEGTGLDSYIDLSIGFSIWLPLLEEGYYLPYGHVGGFDVPAAHKDTDPQLTRSKVIAAISPYLSTPQHGKTFHMGAARYDLHVAQTDGYTIRGCVWDTLDAMHLMNEHEPSYGLKPLTQKYGKYFGVTGTVFTFEDLFGNRSPAPFNTELVGIYAINDVKYGWGLCEFQFEMMQKYGRLFDCYALIDSKLPETDVFMERCGFCIDLDQLRALEAEYEPKVEEATRRVFETYGIDEEFVRKMDRTINAAKIQKWIAAQQKRIRTADDRITKKLTKVNEMKAAGKTHTKSYQNELEMLAKYRKQRAELVDATVENAPQDIKEFVITNGNHIAYLIYDHLGIKDQTSKIERGKKRSTKSDVLDIYFAEEPSLEPLATVAEYTKLLTTYIRPILGSHGVESVMEVDGRLHTNFKAGGTATGRYSSSSYRARKPEVATWL